MPPALAAMSRYDDIKHLVSSVDPVPVGELISYVPEDLDMLVRQWLRIDPQMRCPGTAATMAERAWVQLAAVLERVQDSVDADFLVGPRVVREPKTALLRAGWHRGCARRPTLWAGTARNPGPWKRRRSGRCHGAACFQRSGDNSVRGQRCRGDVVAHHESPGRRVRQDTR